MLQAACAAPAVPPGPSALADGGEPMEFLMRELDIELSTPVDMVMRRWPDTIRTFLNRRMKCPGCPIACFHSVADACREHHVDAEAFLGELRALALQAA